MITGTVTAGREAVVALQVRALGGKPELVHAVLDTGFTDFLALPHGLIAQLGLPFRGSAVFGLADGSEARLSAYRAIVEWHGRPRPVTVLGIRAGAVIGMALLQGSLVTLKVVTDGPVRIEPISSA